MAVSAYILIQTEVGKQGGVLAAVRAITGVVEADEVAGAYDLIVKASADTFEDLSRQVISRIQLVEGLSRTITCHIIHLE
jgi:DNA-binding Lrp family transcriptional regulator